MDVAELVDRALITDALHAYCDRVDRSDLDALLDLFTDDAVLDMGGGATATGRAALRPFMIERIRRWEFTNHRCSTTTVRAYDGITAETLTYVSVLHDDPGRDETLQLWGRYGDEWVKQAGAWRIRVRRFRVDGVHHGPSTPLPARFERFPRAPLPTPLDPP